MSDRRTYGRHARQKFYRHELGEETPRKFVDDFKTLAKWTGPDGDQEKAVCAAVNSG